MRLYPPFANDPDAARGIRQVQIETIPRQSNTTPPHIGAPRLLKANFESSLTRGADLGDAVRIDVFACQGSPLPSEYIDRFLELARMFTLQWWITRDRRANEGYLRNSFTVNEHGERLDGISVSMRMYGGMRIEKIMTREIFESVIYYAARDRRSPLSILSLCDAIYFHGIGDERRCIIEAAVACEALLAEHSKIIGQRLGLDLQAVGKEFEKGKFESRLASSLFGTPFALDHPAAFEWLKALWVARNNVAHGKPAIIVYQSEKRRPTPDDLNHMMHAVVELFMWFQKLAPFAPIAIP